MSEPGQGHNSGLRWIALSVDARFHPLIGCGRCVKPADPTKDAWSRFEAWIDLICEASWKQREVVNKGKTILLERGELMAARGWLAKRWNWTEKQVRGFLERLEAEFMLSEVGPKTGQQKDTQNVLQKVRQKGQQKQNLVKVLSVCNYDLYQTAKELNKLLEGQRIDLENVQQIDHQKGQQRASEGPEQYKEYKGYTDPLVNAQARKIANPASWAYNAAIDPDEKKAQQDVAWSEDGALVAMNGFEVDLRRRFPRVNLEAGLAAAAGDQFPNKARLSAKQIKAAVVRRFGFMEQDEAGKDRRAAARQQQTFTPAQTARGSPQQVRRDAEQEHSRKVSEALAQAVRELEEEQAESRQ